MPRFIASLASLAAAALLALGNACAGTADARPIRYGEEPCDYCRMTISDPRFGAEAVTSTGKHQLFDSIECLAGFVVTQDSARVRGTWVTDWNRPGTLIPVAAAEFRRLRGAAGSPMGRGFVATARGSVPNGIAEPGPALAWADVVADVRAERDSAGPVHAR